MNKYFAVPIIILFFVCNATIANARDYVVGLSPYQTAEQSKDQVKALLGFFLDNAEPGDSIRFYDAFNLRTLGSFTLPSDDAYRHPKAKVAINKKIIAALFAFAKTAKEPSGDEDPRVSGALRLPQFLKFIGKNLNHTGGLDLIVLGSPLYDDPKEKDYSMAQDTYVPAESQINALPKLTPFGTQGNGKLLENIRIHLAYPDESWKKGNQHSFLVERLWALYSLRQGGALVTFVGDLPILLDRVKNNSPAPTHNYNPDLSLNRETIKDNKINIVVVDKNSTTLETEETNPQVLKSSQVLIFDRNLSQEPVSDGETFMATNVEVGITWEKGEEAIDLDLYGRPSPQAKVLYFGSTTSPEGEFPKDFTSSPTSSNNSYETIRFHVPVNIRHLFLAINVYSAKTKQDIKGEIRITLNNKTYSQAFKLGVRSGNGGYGERGTLNSGKASNAHWIVIDPLQVIGLIQS